MHCVDFANSAFFTSFGVDSKLLVLSPCRSHPQKVGSGDRFMYMYLSAHAL